MSGRVVAVAQFPPPVHGMAVAVNRLVTELEQHVAVRRVAIGAPGLERSLRHHPVRIARVLGALAVLTRERSASRQAFFSCDAGLGMVYTLLLVVWARLCGYRMHLQHHSYAYVTHRSALLALLVRVAGAECTHLVICARMRADFRAAYPGAATRVVGVAAGIEPGPPRDRVRGPRMVLGVLGNVTVEKGLDLALAVTRAATREGLPVELRVAGPIVDPVAAGLLDEAVTDPGAPVVLAGPVYGADRDAFLADLDVFLFPSRYPHEAFGLVAWEAMACGVPLLAHRSGCTTAEAVGPAGLVIERDEDFVGPAVEALRRWWRDPTLHAAAGAAARERALATAAGSRRETTRFCGELASTEPSLTTTDRAPTAAGAGPIRRVGGNES